MPLMSLLPMLMLILLLLLLMMMMMIMMHCSVPAAPAGLRQQVAHVGDLVGCRGRSIGERGIRSSVAPADSVRGSGNTAAVAAAAAGGGGAEGGGSACGGGGASSPLPPRWGWEPAARGR